MKYNEKHSREFAKQNRKDDAKNYNDEQRIREEKRITQDAMGVALYAMITSSM